MVFCYFFCYPNTVFCYLSIIYSHLFCHLWNCNLKDELVCPERWSICTISLLLTADTIKALAKLLDIVICFEECCYLRITRKVGVTNVVWIHLSW